ncbi:hypothetical protein BDP27DRAFT_1418786 [Rhodocollybia butyracea]|uniref:BHLH domain-containing protein n=1 Tax=Rhodocollybia butyracea TaxID=206335 RepID=A0A9P5PYN3_9AGAR|nr:hypothetical protein BDP27DRAFT_1418786 [Rhodocollybia butyracea]
MTNSPVDQSSRSQTPSLSPVQSSPSTDPAPDNSAGDKKRKQHRASTAERRASHNAVERQRRDTLNGRFLDLAAILPNVSRIRRPSKSAIVNSSIAYLHASRRHRLLASRELRLLKFEADALRRELNDWRDRASIRRVEEPIRSDAFSLILSGELEILPVEGDNEDGEEGEEDNSDHAFEASAASASMQSSPVAYTPYPMQPQMSGRPPMPMIATPGGMAVENPAAAYNTMGGVPEPFSPHNMGDPVVLNKWVDPYRGPKPFVGSSRMKTESTSSRDGTTTVCTPTWLFMLV